MLQRRLFTLGHFLLSNCWYGPPTFNKLLGAQAVCQIWAENEDELAYKLRSDLRLLHSSRCISRPIQFYYTPPRLAILDFICSQTHSRHTKFASLPAYEITIIGRVFIARKMSDSKSSKMGRKGWKSVSASNFKFKAWKSDN